MSISFVRFAETALCFVFPVGPCFCGKKALLVTDTVIADMKKELDELRVKKETVESHLQAQLRASELEKVEFKTRCEDQTVSNKQ